MRLSGIDRPVPAGETAAGTGNVGHSALLDHGLRLALMISSNPCGGPSRAACLASSDTLILTARWASDRSMPRSRTAALMPWSFGWRPLVSVKFHPLGDVLRVEW
jgi:hypothetical protein